ncbi:DUF460 domain-containing protein [Sulfolobus tengchongensis]|uniref:DUF460 domain-containing protein n=1 Tax=Sulfolobus tengchongensis TaxID=207809 RepID=A0AAX4L021_9CREN
MKIMGVDIEPMESPSKSQPMYSVIIIDEGEKILYKSENVSLSRLIRLCWEYNIDVLALDNIYELGENDREIVNIIKLLPQNTNIVQVTYHNGEFKQLKELAREIGYEVQGKLTPQKTAYLDAILALRGYGTSIKVEEKRTKIIVSRGRALGPGGMSQNRYKRFIRGTLLRVAKDIKEKLDAKGLDYDMIVRRSRAGIEGAVFIVYAPRDRLFGIVKKMRGHDVVVDIKPIYKNKIEFKDKKAERRLIVGIDPGIEVGISVIDIYGKPVLLTSKRSIDRDDIISLISKEGKAIIVATDVNPLPDTVKKIASKFNARLFIPEKSLSVEEKQRLIEDYSKLYKLKIDNPHIRDSLAAALKAYYEVENKIRQIESFISRLDIDIINENKIYDCVIYGSTLSECIEKEIEKYIKRDDKKIEEKSDKKDENIMYKLTRLEEENKELKLELSRYKKLIYNLIAERDSLLRKIDEIKLQINRDIERDRKIYELNLNLQNAYKLINELEIRELTIQRQLGKLKEILYKLINGNAIVLKKNNGIGNIFFDGNNLYIIDEKVSNEIAEYADKEIVILDKCLLKDSELLYKELQIEKSKNIDIKKIIDEYRNRKIKRE